MTGGWGIVYVCERDRVKDFVYITRSVITRVFPVDPDNSVIMELQCTSKQTLILVSPLSFKNSNPYSKKS